MKPSISNILVICIKNKYYQAMRERESEALNVFNKQILHKINKLFRFRLDIQTSCCPFKKNLKYPTTYSIRLTFYILLCNELFMAIFQLPSMRKGINL